MLKILFLGMLEASSSFYGDSIGLAPIVFASSDAEKPLAQDTYEDSWAREYDR